MKQGLKISPGTNCIKGNQALVCSDFLPQKSFVSPTAQGLCLSTELQQGGKNPVKKAKYDREPPSIHLPKPTSASPSSEVPVDKYQGEVVAMELQH